MKRATMMFKSPRTLTWWRRLAVMTRKELWQLFRDLPLMAFVVYSFTLSVYLTGSGIQTQLRNAGLLVYDEDHRASSRELIRRFHPPYFRFDGELFGADEGVRRLDRGESLLVLDLPPRFHESLHGGESVAVQLLVDTTNSAQGLSAAGYATRIIGEFGREAALARIGAANDSSPNRPMVLNDHRVWYNPNQTESWFESVSHLLRMITIFAIMLPAAALVREKEHGTVEQLLVSPLTPFQIMLSKVLAMTAAILVATAVALFGIMRPVFGVPVRGSVTLFFALTALFVFTTAGMGLLAASLARNQAQVGMMTLLAVAPMLLLSGITTPLEAMPVWVRALMALSPLRYFIDIAHGILFKGAGLPILWPMAVSMAMLGVALFGFGMWRFRRQFR
ncbi:MAG TPA: ABC transporter permease [Nitrospiraceae bacterium]|jgi:ABC-2 type transport system permease protein|nr:ABC transporter permease [Nitrospiraceae bacterium]